MRHSTSLLPVGLAVAAFAAQAAAQEVPAVAQDVPAPSGMPVTCGEKTAAFQTDKKARLWVVRRGAITEDNPLRPLSADPLVVLEVIVGNRAATALGPDYANLHRGAAPATLEEQNKTKIAWAADPGLPNAFRIVSEDGAVATAFAFAECSDAPKPAAAPPKAAAGQRGQGRPRGQARDGGARDPALPPGFSLPQGAVR